MLGEDDKSGKATWEELNKSAKEGCLFCSWLRVTLMDTVPEWKHFRYMWAIFSSGEGYCWIESKEGSHHSDLYIKLFMLDGKHYIIFLVIPEEEHILTAVIGPAHDIGLE